MQYSNDQSAEGMNLRKKVLVIDDDVDFGLALKYFFKNKPFDLVLAHTLIGGLTSLEEDQPDHVFLDNRLPDGLGWERAEYIIAKYPLIKLNLMSSLRTPKPAVYVHRILQKPISLDEMLSCMD